MKLALLFVILAIVAAFSLVIVVALYLHKRNSSDDIRLIGEIGQVDTRLDPEGTVIVCGELWRARSKTGTPIQPMTEVRVVGFNDHLALVELCD
jgi:membrane-bound ClpP family serine protease